MYLQTLRLSASGTAIAYPKCCVMSSPSMFEYVSVRLVRPTAQERTLMPYEQHTFLGRVIAGYSSSRVGNSVF